jgi:hypothetical protein
VLLFGFLSLCLVLEYFSTVISTYEAGIEWCAALFVIPFFVFGLKSIFQQSTQFLPISRVSDVLLLCDSFLYVWS